MAALDPMQFAKSKGEDDIACILIHFLTLCNITRCLQFISLKFYL